MRVECDGLLRDTMRLLVDGRVVGESTGAWLASNNDVSGTWSPVEGGEEKHHVRAWVGSTWTSGLGRPECRIWWDGAVVFEDNIFTRAVDLIASARRAVAKL